MGGEWLRSSSLKWTPGVNALNDPKELVSHRSCICFRRADEFKTYARVLTRSRL